MCIQQSHIVDSDKFRENFTRMQSNCAENRQEIDPKVMSNPVDTCLLAQSIPKKTEFGEIFVSFSESLFYRTNINDCPQ